MKLTFYGGAESVTGSNYLLEIPSTGSGQVPSTDSTSSSRARSKQPPQKNPEKSIKILIDCGLFQGESFLERNNWNKFPYNPAEIDAVLVTHSHIDHTGRLPLLFKNGFRGKIYSTPPTKDATEHLLLDSQGILSKEALAKNLPLLYDLNEVNETMRLWQKVSYHEPVKIGEAEAVFYDAGHILGSSFIVLKANGKKIIFSGDLGNIPAPLVKDTEKIPEADYVLIESAYGGRKHEPPGKRKHLLEDVIEETVKSGGTLLIPAFAMERTQELLYELNDLVENKKIPPVSVFVDSPLAIKLTAIYTKYSKDPAYVDDEALACLENGDAIFDFPRLHLSLTTEQSKEINSVPPPKIIIAGSGMSHGGRILHHEIRYLPDPKSTILFVGYQARRSLGRKILDGAQSVKIFGEIVPVNLKVRQISGYSAHADQTLLIKWLKPAKKSIKKVFVVQGEKEESEALARRIKDELAVHAIVPTPGESVEL